MSRKATPTAKRTKSTAEEVCTIEEYIREKFKGGVPDGFPTDPMNAAIEGAKFAERTIKLAPGDVAHTKSAADYKELGKKCANDVFILSHIKLSSNGDPDGMLFNLANAILKDAFIEALRGCTEPFGHQSAGHIAAPMKASEVMRSFEKECEKLGLFEYYHPSEVGIHAFEEAADWWKKMNHFAAIGRAQLAAEEAA